MRDLAPLLLRLFLAFVLMYGTLDNVLSHERMLEFQQNIAVLAMLVGAVFFLLYGAPRYSVDAWRERGAGHG